MKSVLVTAPDHYEIRDVTEPTVSVAGAKIRIRACGICGSDPYLIHVGYIPIPGEPIPESVATGMPLGHEAAGEVVEIGPKTAGLQVGDHVVINPMSVPWSLLGCGYEQGALSEYITFDNVEVGRHVRVIPSHVPFPVAALNEPMAVAFHAVNRTQPTPQSRVVIFGAGPVGLGALLSYRRRGVAHITVVDIIPSRLDKARQLGADDVINSAVEDLEARLYQIHGEVPSAVGGIRCGADIYLDAAGAPAIPATVFKLIKTSATYGVVAIHKKPVEVDLQGLLMLDITIALSGGYTDTEIFTITDDLIDNWEQYAQIISDPIPYTDVERGLNLALTPGAADKIVIVFDE